VGTPKTTLLIACGALAREVSQLVHLHDWHHVSIRCLPAELHNRPESIPVAMRELLEKIRDQFDDVLVAYGDCGTGGQLDELLAEYGARRLPGAHCYEFLAGADFFEALHEAEPGTFYLTDFLVRHFDRLVIRGLGLDRHPELHSAYFGNYRRVVYLAQARCPDLVAKAHACADRLGLELELRFTGLGPLERVARVGGIVDAEGQSPASHG
jgi:hypothetical protein